MTDTITALQERIEETKRLKEKTKLMYDSDDAELIIIENQLVSMSAQIEILNRLEEMRKENCVICNIHPQTHPAT